MEANYLTQIKVGIFTLVGIVILTVSVLALGGNKFLFRSTYFLKVQLDQVQGLSRGSVVSLMGFPVGNVNKISFIPGSHLIEVEMKIDEQFKYRITQGTEASVKTQGALGDKYIYLEPGKPDAPVLAEGEMVKSGETTDFIEQIATQSEKLSAVGDVIEQLNILLKNLNHEGNSQRLVKNLADGGKNASQFFATAEGETLHRLNSILKKIDEGDGTMGALINDPSLHKKVMGFFGETKRNQFLSPLLEQAK